jgi:hypothetical protein
MAVSHGEIALTTEQAIMPGYRTFVQLPTRLRRHLTAPLQYRFSLAAGILRMVEHKH